ncbi:HU family DNA-binding protein [Leptolyngbya sp. FACHB-261]|uniref:HU family DNA-binding protein n=1 Tax=Leptolyngbya sp. FACHB-261 TaxID=2692806 RepID=UPI001681C7AC|nr:HU family DNA-binding protein [Leptolyngbya sp. FACHB-261]MBD2103341.1 HU family DNA-binding protein [Leptolyngbya sp. FACHB-261]
MNKADLVSKIAAQANVTQKTADAVLSAILDVVMEEVSKGEKISLVGFGTFERRDRAAREGRNPQTGQTMKIEATQVPAFTPGKGFKAAVAPGEEVE